jgi:hypothetical protein
MELLVAKIADRFKILVTTIILSAIILIIGAELMARAIGLRPIQSKHFANEPIVHVADPVLGWRNKPGSYNYAAYVSGSDNIQITILPNGERATKSGPTKPDLKQLITIGCSFTQGWAVSDQDTFAWKLQDKNPHLDVRNQGTSGYSTYQALLSLQQVLPTMSDPKFIIYGFMDDHETRNVAPDHWLKALSGVKRSQSAVPFLSLSSNNELQAHHPKKYRAFPLRTRFASVVGIENIYARFKDFKQNKRLQQKSLITAKIIYDMKVLSNKHGADFYMVILSANAAVTQYYLEKLPAFGVKVVDCTHPDFHKLFVPGEGHPNDQIHSSWADCINSNLPI